MAKRLEKIAQPVAVLARWPELALHAPATA